MRRCARPARPRNSPAPQPGDAAAPAGDRPVEAAEPTESIAAHRACVDQRASTSATQRGTGLATMRGEPLDEPARIGRAARQRPSRTSTAYRDHAAPARAGGAEPGAPRDSASRIWISMSRVPGGRTPSRRPDVAAARLRAPRRFARRCRGKRRIARPCRCAADRASSLEREGHRADEIADAVDFVQRTGHRSAHRQVRRKTLGDGSPGSTRRFVAAHGCREPRVPRPQRGVTGAELLAAIEDRAAAARGRRSRR